MKVFSRIKKLFLSQRADAFISGDFAAGLIVFIILSLNIRHSEKLMLNATAILITEVALGIAILGVILTALSILVAFLDGEYLDIIVSSSIGINRTVQPYKTIATVAATGSLISLLALLLASVANHRLNFILFSAGCGFTTWSIIGTVQIIKITAFHGLLKSRLPEIPAAVNSALRMVDSDEND